jgi:hypothetical protein
MCIPSGLRALFQPSPKPIPGILQLRRQRYNLAGCGDGDAGNLSPKQLRFDGDFSNNRVE